MVADHQYRRPLWYKPEKFLLQLESHNLQIFYHSYLFCEANIITQLIVCHVMLMFGIDILCCGEFLQVTNSNKTCLLSELWNLGNA